MKFLQPAAVVADLDRHPRQHLLLDRRAALPVAGPHAPAAEAAPDPASCRTPTCRSWCSRSAPQKSPPVARRSCAALFNRSQSGTKLPLASVHVRVAVVEMRDGRRLAMNRPPFCAASRYRPTLNLSDVLPLPNTSIGDAAARRQVVVAHRRPWFPGTSSTVGRKRTPPTVTSGKIARRAIEPQRALQRHPADRPLLLRVERVVADALLDRECD